MAFSTLITITAGADTGPFNLYSNLDGFLSPFETNVPKINLEAGYLSVVVPDATTTIRVSSLSVICPTSVDLPISGITTTTSTSTSSTTTTSTSSTTTTTTTEACTITQVGVDNIISLNIPITGVNVNGVAVTHISGNDFPIPAGFSGIFTTNQIGVFTIQVFYGAGLAGQKITVIDSDSVSTCTNLGSGGGSFSVPDFEVNCSNTLLVIGEDGTC